MIVEIINKIKAKIDLRIFEKIAKEILQEINFKNKIKIELVFVSDSEIKRLNNKYRNKNIVTDVLSFSFFDLKRKKKFFWPQGKIYFGQIVISYNQAKRQARDLKHSIKEELIRLFVHGMLHLFGYEHKVIKEYQKMEKLEEKIIKNLN